MKTFASNYTGIFITRLSNQTVNLFQDESKKINRGTWEHLGTISITC